METDGRRILFLDVDGVLNSATFFAENPPMPVTSVDPRAVRRIRRVVEATGALVVLSSSWRKQPELVDVLRTAGVPIHDLTPTLTGPNGGTYVARRDEILAWLNEHPEVTSYAIIDDDPDAEVGGHFVRTYWRLGMYGKHERAIVALLAPVGEKS